MTRALVLGLVLLTTACGNKTFESLCATQVPPPPACNTPCDQSPGAASTCPVGYHCSADGKCDTVCTPSGTECGNGYFCTHDGNCQSNGGTGDPIIDSSCPAVHFTAMPTTPSITLLIDRSGSMLHDFADKACNGKCNPEKYQTVQDALVGTQGVVTQLQDKVLFGATEFSADPGTACPTLKTVVRGPNTKTAIDTLMTANRPNNMANTPTPPSIDAVVADFMTNKPPAGSPPVIVLATDGLPNQCNDPNTSTTAESVTAAKNAYAKGIRLFILGVGTIAGAAQHLQDMANAGAGVRAGQPNAKAYSATDPTQLAAAFQEIIRGVVSCDLVLNGHVDPTEGQSGSVTLNGNPLAYGTDWTLDPGGLLIHLVGNACTTLKATANPVVDASFSCGSVIL